MRKIEDLIDIIDTNPDSDRAKGAKIELEAQNIIENRKRAKLQIGLNFILALFTLTNVYIGYQTFQMKKEEQRSINQQKNDLNKKEHMERHFNDRLNAMQSQIDCITDKPD